MASPSWRAARPLKSLLREQYSRFNVYQLVRLLQWRRADTSGAGGGTPAARKLADIFRFRADLSSAFPGHEISGIKTVSELVRERQGTIGSVSTVREFIEIRTPDYVVASVIGPMPDPYTDWVRQQEKLREHAMADFLDLFNQRLNVLRFEGKARQSLGLNTLPPGDTAHAYYLASLMGVERPELAAQIPLPRRGWLALSGLLSNCRKSASTLAHVMSVYLNAKATVTEFVGAWHTTEPEDRMALGRHNHQLGRRTILGRRIWDQQSRIRLEVEALDYERFCMLLPPNRLERAQNEADRSYFDSFVALVRMLVDRQCDCEVHLSVDANTIPDAVLQKHPAAVRHGLRLGQNAWLEGGERTLPRHIRFVVRAWENTIVQEAA